jgi:hypothetical protein
MRRLQRATTGFLLLAAFLLVAQFVSAFFVRVTVRAQPTATGWVVPPTKTYMQAFGASEVILTLLSLGALVLVASVLLRRSARGALGAGPLAWGVSALAAALGLVGFVYLFGVGVCLLVACATVARHATAPHPMATIGASSARPPVEPLNTASP